MFAVAFVDFDKGAIGCDIHFYKLFELKCVLAVCVHNHHIMKKIHRVFFFLNLVKSFPCDVTKTMTAPMIVD